MDMLRFDGQAVLITGAGGGVGRAHALELASRGARVVVADLGTALDGTGTSSGPADSVVREIRDAGGEAVACGESVTDPAGVKAMVEAALDSFGRLDAVINNAGIHFPRMFEEYSVDDFRRMFEVHFFGTLQVCQLAWEHFKKNGGGRIVNTVSEGSLGLSPTSTAYGSAKAAVMGLVFNLAAEGGPYNIKVNGFCPHVSTRLSAPEIMEKAFGRPAESFGHMAAMFPPEKTPPAMVYLTHESCKVNGVLLSGGGNHALRWAVMQGQMLVNEDMSAELIAANIDQMLAMANPQHMGIGISGKPSLPSSKSLEQAPALKV